MNFVLITAIQSLFSIAPVTNEGDWGENARLLAEHHAKNIQPGHGFFFDFSATPELKEPVYKYFIEVLGWTLDYDGSFLRKPEPTDELYYTFWEDFN